MWARRCRSRRTSSSQDREAGLWASLRDEANTALSGFWEHPPIEAAQEIQAREAVEDRLADLLADAAAFFETNLWESASGEAGRELLDREGIRAEIARDFGIGYAPIGPDKLISHLSGLGYSIEEVVAAGLATRSVRGRVHAHFRSRVMLPVKDRDGRVRGFAGLGTHVGPSWALWVTSPDVGLYRRSAAVFGIDQAVAAIARSGQASVKRDSIEVLRAHQEGRTDAVAVHTPWVTHSQLLALSDGLDGGRGALHLDLPAGMHVDSEPESATRDGRPPPGPARPAPEEGAPETGGTDLKRIGIVIATALAAVNVWTVAPVLAVWVGAHAQGGKVLSLRGVATVLVVFSVLAFLLAWALAWLNAKYDELTGRPATLTRTSPWYRRMRGELDEHFRTRYALSAPERVVAACVILGVLAFEAWFFFFAGSSLPS
jgi:hypothetical protein